MHPLGPAVAAIYDLGGPLFCSVPFISMVKPHNKTLARTWAIVDHLSRPRFYMAGGYYPRATANIVSCYAELNIFEGVMLFGQGSEEESKLECFKLPKFTKKSEEMQDKKRSCPT